MHNILIITIHIWVMMKSQMSVTKKINDPMNSQEVMDNAHQPYKEFVILFVVSWYHEKSVFSDR